MPIVKSNTIVLQRNNIGQLRIRADFDVDTEYGKRTMSRQMEEIASGALLSSMSEDFDAVFALLNQGIPPLE